MNLTDVADPGVAPPSQGPERGLRRVAGPRAPRLQDLLRLQTRNAILAAAEDVIGVEGLAARMETIAARAGVAVGTVYKHFEDRQTLLAALVRSRREACLACVDEALSDVQGQPLGEQFRAFLAGVERDATGHGPLLRVLIEATEGAAEIRTARSLLEALERRADEIIERGVAAGELKPDPAKVFSLALVSLARALVVRVAEGGIAPRRTAEALADVFSTGTAGRAPRRACAETGPASA